VRLVRCNLQGSAWLRLYWLIYFYFLKFIFNIKII
jgi:hypothetical protein